MEKNNQKIMIVIFIFLAIFILFLWKQEQIKKDAYVKILVNGQEILISEYSENTIFDLETLTSEQDTMIEIESRNYNLKINHQTVKNSEKISLGKLSIHADNKIEIETSISRIF
ncbi:MAG: hypothetical protein HFJ35_03725 [Clostridia bacterium]|nr:hypothetical protein [Clostridia bacterium]